MPDIYSNTAKIQGIENIIRSSPTRTAENGTKNERVKELLERYKVV